MGTKSNPGKFDCWSKAEPDEPVFVLLGRDPVASVILRRWVELRQQLGATETEVLSEAMQCAVEMRRWAMHKGKGDQVANAIEYDNRTQAEVDHLYEHVLKLQNLCHRAADAIDDSLPSTKPKPGRPGALDKWEELADLVRELRSA